MRRLLRIERLEEDSSDGTQLQFRVARKGRLKA
jgi:hypothetical protein